MRAQELVADGLLTISDACDWLGVKTSTLYKLMEQGELPYAKIGRKRLIPKRALTAYAAEHLVGMLAGRKITEEVEGGGIVA